MRFYSAILSFFVINLFSIQSSISHYFHYATDYNPGQCNDLYVIKSLIKLVMENDINNLWNPLIPVSKPSLINMYIITMDGIDYPPAGCLKLYRDVWNFIDNVSIISVKIILFVGYIINNNWKICQNYYPTGLISGVPALYYYITAGILTAPPNLYPIRNWSNTL